MRSSIRLIGSLVILTGGPGPSTVARADCPGVEVSFAGGVLDEFAPPTEPTDPSPEYVAYMLAYWPQSITRVFDTPGDDVTLIHSFTGWTGPICGARLEIRLWGQGSLSTNDSVRLSLVGGSDPAQAFLYWTTIRNVTGSWGPGSVATLNLDLSDLPPYVSFPTNILDALSDGSLELAVEDDTAVDYATLYVCHCPVSLEGSSWGRIKAGYKGRSN